ncbi:MAG: hypothetical protein LUK37_20600 [Clostridia bacterium]|nr:hypothetical protein [Clostridia bacterium]
MTKRLFQNRYSKLLYVFLMVAISLVFNGCTKQELMPKMEFPLPEEALTMALEETALPWSIEQRQEVTDGTTIAVTYILHLPGTRSGYNSVAVNSYESKEYGRTLQILFAEPQNKEYWLVEDDACWEDWHEILVLIARIYGGFEDAEEIYRACSAGEFPKDVNVLWEGTLTGGYFRMVTTNPMTPQRFKLGNTLIFNVYESEDSYLQFQKGKEDIP